MSEYPLSPAQQAIWFEDQLDTDVGNTGFFGVSLLGELREEHVELACEVAVRRHGTMRTLLRMRGSEPVLEVQPPATPLRYAIAEAPCEPGEETAATRAWRDRHTLQRFDLTTEMPVTFTLLRHGPDRRSLLVVAHHIGYDGRSKFAFARTFCAALTDLRAGRVPEDSELPWPHWPAATDEALAGASAYWQAVDVDSCPPLRVPRRTTEGDAAVGTTGEIFLDAAVRARLVELAEANDVSLFAVMLTGIALTLYGYGNNRMVLCGPVDVTTEQTRGLIGLGVNIVPFTLTVEDTDTVCSILPRAAGVRAHLKAYGAVPFQMVSTGRGRALFSRLGISYMRMATDVPEVPGLRTQWDFIAHNTARTFDLMIHMRDAYNRLVIRLDHAGADLDSGAAATILDHLRLVLSRLADRPAAPVRTLALLPAESAVVAEAAAPSEDLAALVARHAADRADAWAVQGSGVRLSYGDLSGLGLPSVSAALGWTGPVAPMPDERSSAALHWLVRHLRLGADNRVLHLATPDSPRFWHECWLAWAGGGTLYLPGSAADRDAVTTVVAPCHLLREFTAGSLRDVVTPMAGLRPSAEIVALARAGVRIHALYADSAAVPVAVQTCEADDLAAGYTPLLQHLAPGVRVCVRGPHGHTLPYGLTGSLVIEAPSHEDTGDLAEIDGKQTIRFHGSAALTVDWAGQRLEIPALERFLMTHPDVADALVLCTDHRPAAYLVPRPGSDFGLRAARLHLRTRSVAGEPRVAQIHVVSELPDARGAGRVGPP